MLNAGIQSLGVEIHSFFFPTRHLSGMSKDLGQEWLPNQNEWMWFSSIETTGIESESTKDGLLLWHSLLEICRSKGLKGVDSTEHMEKQLPAADF